MKHSGKAAAVLMSGLLALTSVPAGVSAETGADLYVTDFEDGDVSAFSKRGDNDTSVIGTSTESPHSGTTCMAVTERSESWNGPSISLEALGCKPGVQYVVSAWVKTQWYNNCMLSYQYTDAEGEQHYGNLTQAVSDGSWVELPETKFSFSEDMKDVQIYIESSDTVDLFVDDFALRLGPTYQIEDIPGLKDVFADYFKFGCACTASELSPQSAKDLILKHHNSITLGNELKPENMLDQAATLKYFEETGDHTKPVVKLNSAARSILNFCREYKIPVRGHVLVWHSQTPGWFFKKDYTQNGEWADKKTMERRMEAYIKGVFEALEAEYSDVDFYAWDVVNEALLDDGSPRRGGMYGEGNNDLSGWTQVWGDNSFIESAFTYARKYAPEGCKLYYNDYNEYMTQKMDAIIKMAESLKAKGLIDGIGMQSHLDVRNGADAFPSVAMYENAVAKYAATGLDIQITELDATVEGRYFVDQADYYKGIIDVAVKYADSISAVVIWGTTDDQSWRAAQTPLLFNSDFTAKPAYYSIIEGISYTTPAPVQTTASEPQPAGDAVRGDADGNGVVELKDAVLLAKVIAQAEGASITAQGSINADVDGTAGIGNGDLIKLLQYIAGAVDKL